MNTISIDACIKTLGLPDNFKKLSRDEQLQALNGAWKKFVRDNHPDVNKSTGAEGKFKLGNQAHEQLLELIKNGGIKYSKPENKKKYKQQDYSSYNSSNDPFDQAIKELFKEFEKRIHEKWKIKKEQTKRTILAIMGTLLIALIVALIVALTVFKIPLLFIIITCCNLFAGRLKKAY